MELDLQVIHSKLRLGKKLSEKEIDHLIDEHWLEWTGKYDLSPCGDLTLIGKREYLNDNRDTILALSTEFPEGDEVKDIAKDGTS